MGSKTTSQVTQAANPQAQAAYSDVVGKAQSVANTPYQPYGGELVAGLNGQQSRAVGQLANAYGAAQPYVDEGNGYLGNGAAGLDNVQNYLEAGSLATAGAAGYQGQASGAFGQATNYAGLSAAALGNMAPYMAQAQSMYGQAAGLATPQSFDAAALSQYMSPYLSSVVDATRANLNEADGQQAQRMTADAIGSGAYGGDRAAIGQAELARQQSLADGQTIAGLYQQGYGQALSQFNAVQGQRAQGAQLLAGLGQGYNTLAQDAGQQAQQYGTLGSLANATGSGYAGLAQNSLGQASAYSGLGTLQGTTGQAYGTMAGLAGNLGALSQSNLISGASAGLQGGTLRQQNAQQQDTAAYSQYMAGLSYPYQNVGFLSNIVQGIGSQEGNTQTTQGNALSQIAGLGTSAIGILGATGGFGANGYLSSIGSTFSDARVKENIAPIGTTHDGQDLYRYNYKGADPRDVKIGLMAQDVERRDPGAVGEVGGIKTVDYDRATRGAALAGLGVSPDQAARLHRAMGGAITGNGMSPMGGPSMPGAALAGLGAAPTGRPPMHALAPAGAMVGLGARPHFDDGGTASPGAPIPSGGLNTSPGALLGGGAGLNTSPTALMGGSTVTARAPQPGLGALRSPLATPSTTLPGYAGGFGSAGLGAAPSGGGSGYVGVSQDPGSSGFSPGAASGADSTGGGPRGLGATQPDSGGISSNAWMGVLAAGLGMMEGNSMSGLSNIGAGASKGLQTYLGLQQRDVDNNYKQRTLANDERATDAKVQEMLLSADRAAKQLNIESANAATLAQNANTTAANTQSEIATRDQQRKITQYQQGYVPGVGFITRDLTNPTAAPVVTPFDVSGQPPANPSAGTPSPGAPPTPTPAPLPTPSAPPPQGGVPAPGARPGTPVPAQPTPALPQPAAPAPSPRSGPVPVGADWSPTLAPVQGYVPPNQMAIGLDPALGKQQSEIGAKGVQEARESAQKAAAAQAQLSSMQYAMAALPKTGLLAPGQFGDERASIAKSLNGAAAVLGAQPVFDPNTIADGETMKKEAFRLGTQMMADTNGGREAGFILQNSVAATPSLNNTPIGFQRLAAGLQQANQYKQDRGAFMDAYYGKFGNLDGAQQEFTRLNPPQAYVNRAIMASIPPDYVQRLQQTARANPAAAQFFDQRFGAGASAAVLGQQR